MEPEHIALDSLSFHLALEKPCFTFYSLYGELLPFLATISHLSIQCGKTGDRGRAQRQHESLSSPTVVFFKCQSYNSLEFLVTYLLLPRPQHLQNIRGKMKHKPILTNYDFPLLGTSPAPLTKE